MAADYAKNVKPDDLTPDTRRKVEEFLELCRERGYGVQVIAGRRSCAEQNAIYAQGRTRSGPIVSYAPGCKSWHVLGRAIDFGFTDRKPTLADYRAVGAIGKEVGFVWGGDFKGFFDGPHLEYHPGMTIEQLCPDARDCAGAVKRSFDAAGPEPTPGSPFTPTFGDGT